MLDLFVGFDYKASLAGVVPFAVYLFTSLVLVSCFSVVYKLFTPYNEIKLIKEKNTAAAISYAGALIGFCLPLFVSMKQSVHLFDFVLWSLIALAVQCVAFTVVRWIFPLIKERIEANETGAAIYLSATSIAVGILNAASMSY